MKRIILALFVTAALAAQSSVERRVLQTVQEIFREDGRVSFSDLYNSERFSADEKTFLGRLYEIFFAIPGLLKSEFEATGSIPSRAQIADSFGISAHSVNLLLGVMEADSRVPTLFDRSPDTGEITALRIETIEAFLASKGGEVKLTQWEGQLLPAFEAATLDGDTISSKDLSGQNTLIYFWFTGCPPCVRIAPILAELDQTYRSSGFQFVGLNADDLLEIGTTNEARREYLAKQGIEFLNANVDAEIRSKFGNINVYPTLFLVDKGGTVVGHFLNFQSRETLAAAIEGMLQD
jgi:thiol-disulfide isomerase/thioredoxin